MKPSAFTNLVNFVHLALFVSFRRYDKSRCILPYDVAASHSVRGIKHVHVLVWNCVFGPASGHCYLLQNNIFLTDEHAVFGHCPQCKAKAIRRICNSSQSCDNGCSIFEISGTYIARETIWAFTLPSTTILYCPVIVLRATIRCAGSADLTDLGLHYLRMS